MGAIFYLPILPYAVKALCHRKVGEDSDEHQRPDRDLGCRCAREGVGGLWGGGGLRAQAALLLDAWHAGGTKFKKDSISCLVFFESLPVIL